MQKKEKKKKIRRRDDRSRIRLGLGVRSTNKSCRLRKSPRGRSDPAVINSLASCYFDQCARDAPNLWWTHRAVKCFESSDRRKPPLSILRSRFCKENLHPLPHSRSYSNESFQNPIFLYFFIVIFFWNITESYRTEKRTFIIANTRWHILVIIVIVFV